MSDKISERKPDGGLKEWIEVFESFANDPIDAELLMLLIELPAHRLRGVGVQAVKLEPMLDPFSGENSQYNLGWNERAVADIKAIKAAGGSVE